ncbi:hypothetical protein D3C71_1785720 [compost metagenome]
MACSMRRSHGPSVNVRKPIICCSMPVPQLLDFSVWPTIQGGTRNQRQIASTENPRDSSSCASDGLMPSVPASVPPSRSGASPRSMEPAKFFLNSSRWPGFRKFVIL